VTLQTRQPDAICVFNDVNKRGASYARQQALELNTCEWTAFLDSDDYFKPEHLQVLADAAKEHDADYVFSWYELVRLGKPLGDVQGHDGVFPRTHFTEPWDKANPRQTTITVLVRTSLARDVGFWEPADATKFPDGHRVGEDWTFTLGCNERGKIWHVPQRTWYWEHHGLNSSGRPGHGDAK
jgi:glycosyltransferase involved in cell wall biosynthesis